jgi:hypothetical protein
VLLEDHRADSGGDSGKSQGVRCARVGGVEFDSWVCAAVEQEGREEIAAVRGDGDV